VVRVVIEPTKITNFERTDRELEMFWLYSLMVAGKNADNTARCLNKMLDSTDLSPFEYMKANQNDLHNVLVANRVGQYNRLEKAIRQSLDLNLRTFTLEELLAIHGVGNKTARFFLLHTRRNMQLVVLDIHILSYLRERWGLDVPKNTPHDKAKYAALAKTAVALIREDYPDLSLADADLLIWTQQSGRLT
jgi:endonuclease III